MSKVVSLVKYAIQANRSNKYEAIDTLTKAEHCNYLVYAALKTTILTEQREINKLTKQNFNKNKGRVK